MASAGHMLRYGEEQAKKQLSGHFYTLIIIRERIKWLFIRGKWKLGTFFAWHDKKKNALLSVRLAFLTFKCPLMVGSGGGQVCTAVLSYIKLWKFSWWVQHFFAFADCWRPSIVHLVFFLNKLHLSFSLFLQIMNKTKRLNCDLFFRTHNFSA